MSNAKNQVICGHGCNCGASADEPCQFPPTEFLATRPGFSDSEIAAVVAYSAHGVPRECSPSELHPHDWRSRQGRGGACPDEEPLGLGDAVFAAVVVAVIAACWALQAPGVQ